MLTQQLRELERDQIVNRIVYSQVPPKVEYELSAYGLTLSTILDQLCSWGEIRVQNLPKKAMMSHYYQNLIVLKLTKNSRKPVVPQ